VIVRDKVHCIGKWVNQVTFEPCREYPLGEQQIPDPYKKSPAFFASIFDQIDQSVEAWAKKLWQG